MDDSQYVTIQKYELLKKIIEQQQMIMEGQNKVLEKQGRYISMVSRILGEDIALHIIPKE